MDHSPAHPVLTHLAVVRAARDFGLAQEELDPLALRFPPAAGASDRLPEAAADALLGDRLG
jgi:hypothetical protein